MNRRMETRSVERQRRSIVRAFVLTNLAEDAIIGAANLLSATASGVNNFAVSLRYLKYDQARRYRDLTGGDFGEAIGQPGLFTGDHASMELEAGDDE